MFAFCVFLITFETQNMKVHLIKRQTIALFERHNARSRSSFRIWFLALKRADWSSPASILKTFGSADLLGDGSDRVVFDIGGNDCRMICHYVFGEKQVHLFVCWIGDHAEYTKLCKENKQYTVSQF